MTHILDYKSLVIENFKTSVWRVKYSRTFVGTDKEAQYADTDNYHLHQAQTYHGLLIQFGMSLSELTSIEESVVVK